MTRSPDFHGTHAQAMEFALNVHDDTLQTYEFLKAWREGDLGEWPEFYEWLDQQPVDPAPWRPIDDDARKDMVWLLIDYRNSETADHPLADASFAATIGFWQEHAEDDGEWKFAGWCWSHDHFTEGRGRVVAYKPIGFMLEYTGDWPLPAEGNLPAECIGRALLEHEQKPSAPSQGGRQP